MISEEAQRFIDAIKEYGVVIGPAFGGMIGYMAGRKKIDAEASKLEIEGEVAQLDGITRHFEALIDGYEKRIADLTSEVHLLRDEVKQLRKALDSRPRI